MVIVIPLLVHSKICGKNPCKSLWFFISLGHFKACFVMYNESRKSIMFGSLMVQNLRISNEVEAIGKQPVDRKVASEAILVVPSSRNGSWAVRKVNHSRAMGVFEKRSQAVSFAKKKANGSLSKNRVFVFDANSVLTAIYD